MTQRLGARTPARAAHALIGATTAWLAITALPAHAADPEPGFLRAEGVASGQDVRHFQLARVRVLRESEWGVHRFHGGRVTVVEGEGERLVTVVLPTEPF